MELEEKNKTQPHLREAHQALAWSNHILAWCWSLWGSCKYFKMLFSGQIQSLTLAQVKVCFEGVPSIAKLMKTWIF